MRLYDYFRSSASFRVRMALNLKRLSYDVTTVHLLKEGGQQKKSSYLAINPQGLVPSLQLESEDIITQSLAMLEYLDEQYPTPPLLPTSIIEKSKVRAMAYAIACDIHPLNNLRVLTYLKENFKITEEEKIIWYHHWLEKGFSAIETMLVHKDQNQAFSFGQTPYLSDLCLIPQVYNALRFEFNMTPFPRISAIYENALALEVLASAFPDAS